MNKIIFDKHLDLKGNNLITGQLALPPPKPKKEAPYLGMITIPVHEAYSSVFNKFSQASLLMKDQVIRAQQEIRKECNDVGLKDIYNVNFTKTLTIKDF
jgi:hypothetical protein